MFGLGRRRSGQDSIERLHDSVVSGARTPGLYGEDALPDTVEGRFECLALHLVLVLRRLRTLPPPAGDVAQELVDRAFAYLEVALRESGIGDFGVPKRMKKLAGAFYERTPVYDAALDAHDSGAVAAELARRLGLEATRLAPIGAYALAAERALAGRDLAGLIEGLGLPSPPVPAEPRT